MGIRERLEDEYGAGNMTPADALFFKNVHGVPAFRLEVPAEHLEFAYGTYIGTDPHGDLYFHRNELDALKNRGLIDNAVFSVKQVVEGSNTLTQRTWAHVIFYVPGSTDILGEFLARDESRLLSNSGISQDTKITGTWEDAIWAHSNARVQKTNAQFDIFCDGLTLQGQFQCTGTLANSKLKRAAEGVLNVRHEAKAVLKDGLMVRWTGNNLVWYHDQNAKVVAAFFTLSNETDPGQLGYDERGEIQYPATWTYHG